MNSLKRFFQQDGPLRLGPFGLALIMLWIGLSAAPVRAQMYDPNNPAPANPGLSSSSDLPDPNSVLSNFGSSLDVQSKVDNILRVYAGEIMSGLQDYKVELTDILVDKVKDELVKTLAKAMPHGSLAEKIMTKYQQKKDENLAKAIDRVRAVAKNSLNKQLKAKYQYFKINYARMEAQWKSLPELKQSVVGTMAEDEYDKLWGEHVAVMGEFSDDKSEAIMKYMYPEIGDRPGNTQYYGYTAFVTDAISMDDAKTYKEILKGLSDKEYDNNANSNNELVAYSHYDRTMMKRAVLNRMRERVNGLRSLTVKVNSHVQGRLKQEQRQGLSTGLGAKSTYLPLPEK